MTSATTTARAPCSSPVQHNIVHRSDLYVHNWTQPGSTAPVGFPNHKWTSTNSTPTVANAYTGTTTNPTSTWTGCVIDRTQPNDATTVAAVHR